MEIDPRMTTAGYEPTQVLPSAARNGRTTGFRPLAPGPRLAPYVVRYWHASPRVRPVETARQRMVPDGCIEMVFDLAGPRIEDAAVVAGPATRPFLAPLCRQADYLGIRFRPGAFFKVFGVPACELTDRIIPLADVIGRAAGSLMEPLQSCRSTNDRIGLMECTVSRRLENGRAEDGRLDAALTAILETAGTIRTADLARRACTSPRQLRRLFDRYVGLSPKTLARIVRFQRVLCELKRRNSRAQLPLALAAGYYDQAHFLHEFREFTGESPTALFPAPRR